MTVYYVDSVIGNDNNNGTQTSPWKTIQRAVNDLLPGDTAYLAGTFREQVNFNNNGTANNYINFEGWPSRSVVWTACEKVTTWVVHGTLNGKTVWKTTLNSEWILPDNKNLLFWDGLPLSIAKYPVNSNLSPFPTFVRANNCSKTGNIATYSQTLPSGLSTPIKVNFGGNVRWSWQTGSATNITTSNITFSFTSTIYGDDLEPSINDPFYVWGYYNLLSPGQFYIEGNIIYLIPPNNLDPNLYNIEIKTRNTLCNPWDNSSETWGKHYYKFKNIVFNGAPISLGDSSSNWQFINCRFQYFSYFINCPDGLLSPEYYTDNQVFIGNNLLIDSCIFNWFCGTILLVGNNIKFINSTVSDGNLFGVNQPMVGIGSSSLQSNNIEINNCSLSRCGRSATGIYNTLKGKILNCEIYDYNRLTNDNGGIYCFGNAGSIMDFGWSEIAYNKVYQENAEVWKTGIYLDHGCSKMVVHHNQSTPGLTNSNPMRLHSPATDIKVYNNSFVSYSDQSGNGISMWGYMGMERIEIKNNIFTAPNYIGIPGLDSNDLQDSNSNGVILQRNLYYKTLPLFVDTQAKDYRLLPNSPAADAGLLLPPYTDNFTGFAPDIGAIDGVASIPTIASPPPPIVVEPPIIPIPPPPVVIPSPVIPPVVTPSYPIPTPPPEPIPVGTYSPPPIPTPIEPLIPLPPVIPPLPVVAPAPMPQTSTNIINNQTYKYPYDENTAIRGISYPFQISNGNLLVSTDVDLVRESIFSVLETRFFERIMRPAYGTPDLLFSAIPNSEFAVHQIQMELESQVENVSFDITSQVSDDGTITMFIDWTLDQIPQPIIKYILQQ